MGRDSGAWDRLNGGKRCCEKLNTRGVGGAEWAVQGVPGVRTRVPVVTEPHAVVKGPEMTELCITG